MRLVVSNDFLIITLGSIIFGDEFKNKKIKGRMPMNSRKAIKLDILNKEVTNFYKVINIHCQYYF